MSAPHPTTSARPCPHAGCGNLNPPRARFCARCGRPLGPRPHAGLGTLLTVLTGGFVLVVLLGWVGVAVWSGLGLIFFGLWWRSDDPRAMAR